MLGSLTCGLATSEVTIIFGRVLSGIGGGGLNSVSTFTATDLIDQRRRGLWQGFGMIVYGAGLGLGGVVGGAMNDNWGWRSAFLLLSPLGLITACGIYVYVPGPKKQKAEETESTMTRIRRIDFLGASIYPPNFIAGGRMPPRGFYPGRDVRRQRASYSPSPPWEQNRLSSRSN